MEIASACAVVLWSCAVATAALLVAAVVPVVAMVALWWLAGWWLEWPLWLAATGLVRALFRMVVMRGRRSFGEIRCSHCWLVRVAALCSIFCTSTPCTTMHIGTCKLLSQVAKQWLSVRHYRRHACSSRHCISSSKQPDVNVTVNMCTIGIRTSCSKCANARALPCIGAGCQSAYESHGAVPLFNRDIQ